ncbi:MAG: hypothetical protein JXQ90_13735 [Cyclobacteriaceae bacterium]
MKYTLILGILVTVSLHAQDRKIIFPDIPGYQTLVCDLHIHTAFSDGSVWPDIRVKEAIFDGVDAISLTEHLEYQPHKADIPHKDRNRSYQLAKAYAKGKDLIVIHGAEITRSMPPGHANALFINDANKLLQKDPMDAFLEAQKQGAFVFWNHPNWIDQREDGIATMTDMHQELIDKGLLHGIEVVNETTYSDEALQHAYDQNLTVIGTSDIHGLIDWLFDIPGGGHRPVTLVFSTAKTEEGIKDGLINRRTVAWHRNSLIGEAQYVESLVMSSLKVSKLEYIRKSRVARIRISNTSDANYIMQNRSEFTLHENTDVFTIPSQGEIELQVKTLEELSTIELSLEVLNTVISPGKHATISLTTGN